MRKLDLLFRENVSKDGFAGVNENEVENWSRESIGKGHFKK